ncbi:hypothetical protein [Streptomyces sp. NPDC102437]|uniref:hypothetical protein n=1 Tax=Streptomyces sp. NPDC102437 TaxID=3366175 RepID=UPI003805EB6B
MSEGVDESALTANALREAVTGQPGQGRTESVRGMDRSEHAEAHRKAENDAYHGALRERAAKSRTEPPPTIKSNAYPVSWSVPNRTPSS